MALIVCPHCGKSVSDTVNVCIHCGKSLNSKEEKQQSVRPYEQLDAGEKDELFKQFSREYFEYVFPQGRERAAKMRKIANISWLITSILCVALVVVRILVATGVVKFSTEGNDFMIPGIILSIAVAAILISTVIWLICRQRANKNMYRFLLFAKLYQTWLSSKEIKYKLVFEESEKKYKKYFNNINPILYMKEV